MDKMSCDDKLHIQTLQELNKGIAVLIRVWS